MMSLTRTSRHCGGLTSVSSSHNFPEQVFLFLHVKQKFSRECICILALSRWAGQAFWSICGDHEESPCCSPAPGLRGGNAAPRKIWCFLQAQGAGGPTGLLAPVSAATGGTCSLNTHCVHPDSLGQHNLERLALCSGSPRLQGNRVQRSPCSPSLPTALHCVCGVGPTPCHTSSQAFPAAHRASCHFLEPQTTSPISMGCPLLTTSVPESTGLVLPWDPPRGLRVIEF